jgi:two-component system sensor kinase FixL
MSLLDPSFEPFFALSHDPMALLELDGAIVRANPAWRRVLQHEPAALAGQKFVELLSATEAQTIGDWLVRVAEASEPLTRITSLRAGSGEYRQMELSGARDLTGRAIYLVIRPHRLHDDEFKHLQAMSQHWDALQQCIADIVITSDLTGTIQTINHIAPGIPLDDVVGAPDGMIKFLAPEQRPAMRERIARVGASGEIESYEAQAVFPDGSTATFESRVGPIRDADGDGQKITGILVVTRDLTRQRQAEEARRTAEQQIHDYTIQLERSNAELERFASVASHDLQEPLRKIQAFGDRLRQKYEALLPEAGRDYINRMLEAAKRMQDLINDLLMFSRLTTKEQRFSPVNLQKILTGVLSDLEVRIEESEARVEFGELPRIEADPVHMRQLFQNLISNAIKFHRPDQPAVVKIAAEILPTTGKADKRPAMLRLTFSDNGIGIEPKYHDRIFGIFERLHSRGKYEGTGVGLAVCRKICDQHGGSIRVESGPDGGSTFIAELPTRQQRTP